MAAPPAPLLLALFAALAAAFLVSQLAGSTATADGPRFPAFLSEALGAPQAEAPLTRKPGQGVSVAIRDDSYGVEAKDGSVSLASKEAGEGQWSGFTNGATRPTAFGAETIVVEPRKTEQYLTVTRRQGPRTWTWKLGTTLEPRLAADGGVDFVIDGGWHEAHKHFHGPQLAQYRISPVAIFDAQGKDVTPDGLRWSLAHRGSSWWLELRLDDSKLPLPYVIDPAITFRSSVGSSNGGEATLVMTMPSGVVANDFLIAQVTVRGGTGTAITPPGGWTPLRRDDNGTPLGQAIYYRVAGSSEPVSYTWDLAPAARASGGIIAYTGVDNADPFDVVGSAGGNSSLVTAPSITTTENNTMVVGFFGIANCNNGGDYWGPPLGMNERYDINSTGSFPNRSNSTGDDVVQAIAGPTGPKTATASSSGVWIAQLVALRLDVTPPAAPVQTISESTAASHASGSTFYYRPAGAGGTFTVTATTNDGTPTQSGINKVNLPGLAGGFTPTTGLDDTASPYQQTYSWTTGSTESGAKTVTATDNAGNTNTGTFTITPDSTAPTTTDNTALIGSGWKNANQIVALTPSDGSGSGTATTYYTTDGTTPTIASPQGTSVSLTSDGSYTIKYFSVDNVGNSESPVTAGTVINIDKTNPTSATLDPLPAAIRNGQVLTSAATDGGPSGIASISYYYCAGPPCTPSTLFGSSSTGPSYSVTWNSQPADGNYQVLARASDNAGNALDSTKQTVTVDNTAPNTSITASPSDPSNDANPSFSFSSTEGGSSFQCQLDTGGWSACTSPKSYSGLAAGAHTFEVRATDPAGNTDASPASYPWTIDLTAPNTSITVNPADPSNDPNPSFSFDSSEAGTFECKLDAGSFASCTSPKSYSGLAAGSHTFEVRATDPAGNTDASPASHPWTIDLTAPNTSITASPADPSNDTGPSFSFDSSEAGTFECKLDAGSFASCSSPKSYSGLAAGSHTFEVRATDAAGNTDGSPATHAWTIDLTAPNTSITASPSDPSNDPNPSFSFDSSEAGTFECKLDAGSFASCSSPKSYSGLSAGSHTFEVRATDAAGNTDATPATHTWTIDLTAPNTSITASPSDPSNDTGPSFSFDSSEAGTFECKLDAGSFASCSSPKSYSGLAAGSHTFEVKATDAAGNTDASPATYTWTIDLTAPNTSITASPSDPSNDANPSFSFDSSEAGTFECKLDAGSFASCSSPKSYSGLAAGSHTFEVKATDAAGNTDATPASYTWTIDLTDPPAPAIDPPSPPEGGTTDGDVDFYFSDSEPGVTFQCRLDGGSFAACSSPKSYTALATGSHTFEVKARDAAGNESSVTSRSWSVNADPETTITASPADPSNDANPSFSFSSSDAGSTFECKLDAGSFASCTSPKSYSGLSAGSHTFEVRAIDPESNVDPTPASDTWTIDLTAPNTSITASPSDPSNDPNPSFSFDSSEAGTFECKLDAGSFASCSSPKSYSGLSAGSHTFEVRARDAAGNTDATPATHTWTIDLTAPNTSVTASPSDPSNDTGPSFGFDSSEAGTFECKLDAGSFASCTSPKSYSGLAAGSHTFEVKATDAAGNTDATPATHTWTIDLTNPNTSITASPADPSNDPNPSFGFDASEAGTFECKLDAGSFASCTSPKSYSGLAAGSHTFEVRATDAAGNTDATPATHTWTLDLAAPNTSITVNPADPSNDPNPSFSFSSSEAATFECKLDAGSFASCTSPKSYSGLSAGSHTFEVRATDAAGNTDATPATHTWTIDLTAPNTSITASPNDPSNDANPSFGFDSSEAGTFECKLDAGSFASCSSPKSYSGLAAGSHTFEVRAIDAAGNTDATPATHTWTLDLTAPNTSITASPADPSNDPNPSFSFSSSEAATFECKLDAGGWGACVSPKSYSGLSAGSHTFEVRATDAAGNTDLTPASHTWTIDLSAPDTTITSQPGNPSNDNSPAFAFSASEAGSTFECELDGGGFQLCPSPHTYAGPLADGPHTFGVRATDAAGNTDATPASFTWTIDTAPPNTTLDSAPPDPDIDPTPTFAFSASEAGSTFECEVDAGGFQACTSPQTFGPLTDGSHTVRVRATDPAGNTDSTPAGHSWTVNAGAPSVAITAPGAFVNAAAADPFTVTATSPDGDLADVEFFRCSDASSDCSTGSWLSLGTDGSAPYTASWPLPADGNAAVRAVATDTGTNSGSHVVNTTVDRTLPITTIDSAPADPSSSTNASFSFSSGEAGASFECRLDGAAYATCASPQVYSSLANGSHTFDVRATDPAGNVGAPDSHTWTIDSLAPDTSLTSTPSDPSSSPAPSFSFTSSEGGSTFQCELDGSGFAACVSPRSYAGLADGSHTFRVRATDAAANTDATPASFTWTIDATGPGSGLVDPGSPLRGSITLSAAPSDAGAGVREVAFEYSPANAGSWTALGTDATAPYSAAWDTTLLPDGLYDLRAIVTDNAMNVTVSPEIEDRRIDNTAPSATMNDPGASLRATVTLTSTTGDSGSGVASIVYERSPAGAGSWAGASASWDTTSVADGLYDLRVVVADAAGNTTASAPVIDRRVDNTAPTVASSTPADGGLVASADSLSLVASEDIGAIQNATIDGAPAPGPVIVGTTVTYSTAFADGPHTLAGELEDLAGNRRPIRIHFTVWSLATADYPYIEKNWLATLAAALAATNGAAEVDAPANGWNDGAAGDWLVLRVDPRPPTPVGNGFELNGDVLDVTAYWALAGGDVHSFLLPIHVVLRNGAANALPMTLENSAWRGIASVPSGQTLPAGWQDGFYRVGSDVHILTRHLSSFSLLRDVQGPSAPGSFRGAKSGGRLMLSWSAASDNSGLVDGYVVYANGAELSSLGAGARSVDLGAFRVSDKRKFQVAARDAAGNLGAKTHQLVIVPTLRGVRLAKAKAQLAARGLKLGKISRTRSSKVPAGRIIKSGRSGVLPTGTKIALTISLGRGGTSSSGSAGSGGSGGRGSTGGTSAGGSAPTPSAPSVGVTPPSLEPSTPPTAPEIVPGAEGESDGRPTLSVTPTSSSSDGGLRRILGLVLLSAAFAAAFMAWWRLQRLPAWRAPESEPTEIVFWDQRLTRLALATVRRVAGRL